MTLRQRLLAQEFGKDNVTAIERNSVYVPSGCGPDIECNKDIDKVERRLLKGFYRKGKSVFVRMFTHRGRKYTFDELAEKLVKVNLASDASGARGLVRELLDMRRGSYSFETEFKNGKERVYFVTNYGY